MVDYGKGIRRPKQEIGSGKSKGRRGPRLPPKRLVPTYLSTLYNAIKDIVADENTGDGKTDFTERTYMKMVSLAKMAYVCLRDAPTGETGRGRESSIPAQILLSVLTWLEERSDKEFVLDTKYEDLIHQVRWCVRWGDFPNEYRLKRILNTSFNKLKDLRDSKAKRTRAERSKTFAAAKSSLINSTSDYDELIRQSYLELCPDKDQELVWDKVQEELQVELQKSLPGIKLERFGSAANGLGFRGTSDIDVVLVNVDEKLIQELYDKREDTEDFELQPEEQELESAEDTARLRALTLIRAVAGYIEDSEAFLKVEVVEAKVPILKTIHVATGTPCDISASNFLPLHNTKLLGTYCEYDPRVKPLLFLVKLWAKKRKVCDASQGTLSSYSWAILVIFFLQQEKNSHLDTDNKSNKKKTAAKMERLETSSENLFLPILPCLQQQGKNEKNTTGLEVGNDIEEFDVFFRSDINCVRDELLQSFPELDTDDSSTGELLVRFFYYYAFVFKKGKYIVSIRIGKPVVKQSNEHSLKSSNGFSIEDPFELERDLGACIAGNVGNKFIDDELMRATKILLSGKDKTIAFEELCKEQPLPGVLSRVCFACLDPTHNWRDCVFTELYPTAGCLFCAEEGHYLRKCPKLKKKQQLADAKREKKSREKPRYQKHANHPKQKQNRQGKKNNNNSTNK